MSTDLTIAELWERTFGQGALETERDTKTFYQKGYESLDLPIPSTPENGITLGKVIGRGGMADVYEAQQHSLCREVAVKQVRRQSPGEDLRFFHHEVRLTAGLNHPNILPIHDLLIIEGRPSLVMKRVNGQSWRQLLSERRQKETFLLHQEVQRLVDVCDAVAFAHSRGVLHLDLKPANVMCGAFGETLVMDWGCAALFDDNLWGHHPNVPRTKYLTKPFGTPAFMAPELARGEGAKLGIHTDIYLLGAILHLLLSGSPIRKRQKTRSTIEMAAQGERKPLPETAPRQLADLCRHATESELADRLCDLSVFRDTLQHWLDTRESQALTERALETLSEMEKAETLTAGQRQEGTQLLGVFEQAGRVGMQLPKAIDGEWRLRSLLAQTALKNGEPGVARILAIPMPQQQKEAIQKQAQELQAQQVQAVSDDGWIGQAMSKDGGKSTELLLVEILKHQREVLGDEHPNTLNSKEDIASLYRQQGRYAESEVLYGELVSTNRRILGSEHSKTLKAMLRLATLYGDQAKYEPAEQLLKQVLDAQVRVVGLEHTDTLEAMGHLALIHQFQGRYSDAEPLMLRAMTIRERLYGSESVYTLKSINDLATLYKNQGRYPEAEPLMLRVLDSYEQQLGKEHLSTLTCVNNLASLYKFQERYEEAEPLYLRAYTARVRTLGEDNPKTITSLSNLASLYKLQGRYVESEKLLLQAISGCEQALGTTHPYTLAIINNLGMLYKFQGLYLKAEPLYLRTLDGHEQALGSMHPSTLTSLNNLARLYESQGRFLEAEPLFVRALAGREEILGKNHPATVTSINNLAWCQLAHTAHIPTDLFLRLMEAKSDSDTWEHHWARMGHALCLVKETGAVEEALVVLETLKGVLGAHDKYVIQARRLINQFRPSASVS